MKFYGGVGVVTGTSDKILVAILITMLTVQSEIWPLLNKLWTDFDEIFRISLQWYKEQLIKFWEWSRSPCWLSKLGIQALWWQWALWPRRSALSEYPCLSIGCSVPSFTALMLEQSIGCCYNRTHVAEPFRCCILDQTVWGFHAVSVHPAVRSTWWSKENAIKFSANYCWGAFWWNSVRKLKLWKLESPKYILYHIYLPVCVVSFRWNRGSEQQICFML